MEKTVRVFNSFEEMKAEEYRYWQSRPVWERMKAVVELSRSLYGVKDSDADDPKLFRTVKVLIRP